MSFLIDDEKSLRAKIDQRQYDLFKAKDDKPQLQVSRYSVMSGRDYQMIRYEVYNQDVQDAAELDFLYDRSTDWLQLFTIRQQRTWTTLNISLEMFEEFLRAYGVFSPIWKYMFTFGRKTQENELQFPGPSRRSKRGKSGKRSQETAYMLRRAENNGRSDDEVKSWSIRQTGVYHQRNEGDEKSTILLVNPSQNAEAQYNDYLKTCTLEERKPSGEGVERILVADSIRGWGDYMACLEKHLKHRSDRIVLANVCASKENLSPLTDFIITFEDRQELKRLEDSVIDLQVILPTLLKTVQQIWEQSTRRHKTENFAEERHQELEIINDEFEQYIEELTLYQERALTLKEKAKATAQLLSDLLSYEEMVALKELTRKSQEESKSMLFLARQSTKDAAAMKILTVIFLIYLPFTIVANFFSTEFVKADDKGRMNVAKSSWLMFAIAIPLTLFTVLLWLIWVRFARVPDFSVPPTPEMKRQYSFRFVMSGRKKTDEVDLEKGGESAGLTPRTTFKQSAVSSWNTVTTAAKSWRITKDKS